MNWTTPPAAETPPVQGYRSGTEGYASPTNPASGVRLPEGPPPVKPVEIRVGKCLAFTGSSGPAAQQEVYTVTLAGQTIELLPLKTWHQLDRYKWTVQGKLPGEPAGLEIAPDRVRIMGGTVALNDPAGCLKLEQLFDEWLRLERETVALARNKARGQGPAAAHAATAQPGTQRLRFQVELDKRGQVHIHCMQGRDLLLSVGLSAAGINSLHQQGLMRRPRTLATGALHDWVELDGELCSFTKGRNDAARLEQLLNERYLPEAAGAQGKQVLVFMNSASSSGFDIQFPVTVAGVVDNHRHHLNDRSLELLQDSEHCGLLHKDVLVRLIPPNLVFKKKTPDGGEQYLPWLPENTVTVTDDQGQKRTLALSQPLNLLRLSPAELNAVFNHPAINRHTGTAPAAAATAASAPAPASYAAWGRVSSQASEPPPGQQAPISEPRLESPPVSPQPKPAPAALPRALDALAVEQPQQAPAFVRALPNMWLKHILAQPALPHDWFAVLTYTKLAERFGNSNEGKFGPCECWFISMNDVEDIADPAFRGAFITEKGSLGFLSHGEMARFYNGVAFLGKQDSALEGIQVDLTAVGLDTHERLVFVVSDNYRSQFGVRRETLGEVLGRLRECGALVMNARELLANADPIEVIWTVPAEQADPSSPEAREWTKPTA
jgi:hypothetical protein